MGDFVAAANKEDADAADAVDDDPVVVETTMGDPQGRMSNRGCVPDDAVALEAWLMVIEY